MNEKTDRYTMNEIAGEMNAIAGGNYFAATRTPQTDSNGYWVYYINEVATCPIVRTHADFEAIMNQARERIAAR